MEISTIDEVGKRWDEVRPSLRTGLAARVRDIGPEELPSFPGMDAIGGLLVAEKARQLGRFDLVVLDGPPHDGLIRALSLPDVLRWLLRLVFGLDRGPGRSRSSQEGALIPATLIAPGVSAPLQDLRVELEAQRARLDSSTGTRIRLVLSAEELAMPGLRTALTGLGLYGMATDELVVIGERAAVSEEARREFSSETSRARPILRVAQLPTTPANRDEWALRGATLYQDGEVFDPANSPRPVSTEREVRLAIPFLESKDLDIALANEEVVVRLGQLRRHVLLPGLATGGRLRAKVDQDEVLRLWVE
jgi:arsenite/tail-anchored protein-transporting ATPase